MDESQVTSLLASAVKAVDSSGAEDDLRAEAFKVAVALLVGGLPVGVGTTVSPAGAVPPAADRGGTARPADSPRDSDDPLERIAAYLGCEREGLHHVFAISDGAPQLTIKSAHLPKATKRAAADICLLLMAGRQGADVEQFTAADTLKAEASRYGRYDATNFSKSLKDLEKFVQTEGGQRDRARKLTQPGIEEAASKVADYVEAATA